MKNRILMNTAPGSANADAREMPLFGIGDLVRDKVTVFASTTREYAEDKLKYFRNRNTYGTGATWDYRGP
jgi:hypothetical protein